LSTAAGVAGGALLFEGIKNMFGSHGGGSAAHAAGLGNPAGFGNPTGFGDPAQLASDTGRDRQTADTRQDDGDDPTVSDASHTVDDDPDDVDDDPGYDDAGGGGDDWV
jgi:hypothetical protein